MVEKGTEGMSKEDIENIKAELEKAKNESVSKETQTAIEKAKEEARKEAEKEFAINAEIKAKEDEIARLKEETLKKEKEAAERYAALTKKVDDMVESKAVVSSGQDPFVDKTRDIDVNKLSDEAVSDIEEKAAREFFGDAHYEGLQRERQKHI